MSPLCRYSLMSTWTYLTACRTQASLTDSPGAGLPPKATICDCWHDNPWMVRNGCQMVRTKAHFDAFRRMKGSTKTAKNSQFCRVSCVDCDLPKTVLYQAELHSDHVVPPVIAAGRVLIAPQDHHGKASKPVRCKNRRRRSGPAWPRCRGKCPGYRGPWRRSGGPFRCCR